jgi:hypothetical protein
MLAYYRFPKAAALGYQRSPLQGCQFFERKLVNSKAHRGS